MLSVSIGLLWNESEIRGNLSGEFAIQCFTECNRWLDLSAENAEFLATSAEAPPEVVWGVRLGECLSPQQGENILHRLVGTEYYNQSALIQAGRIWESSRQSFDNRVWWPVIQLSSRDEGHDVIGQLRDLSGIHPIGLTVVQLNRRQMGPRFSIRIGDFESKVLEVRARPKNKDAFFELEKVPIGRGFHWERKERLSYRGELRVFPSNGPGLTAANDLLLESYIETAVGSEMRDDLPAAFSQAQAIAARSTVLATANRHHFADGFDLCNDDHCQCYQGIARESGAVIEPIRKTAGQVLIHTATPLSSPRERREARVVDARYAKSCGGVSDIFRDIWGEEEPGYFAVRSCGEYELPDLSDENKLREFIDNPPPAFCNPKHHPYPKPWDDDPLFRWTRAYPRAALGEIIFQKTGKRIGSVQRIIAHRRATSGRIIELEVIGKANHVRLFGELEIRRALSGSHLPSSCFIVDEAIDILYLRGGGWGHGVGLCQLGATAMAKEGWNVKRILDHYYPNTRLEQL
ncbi:hypothetical protein IT157_05800 [bacterium]|nr:hypothetical protein [bacterium]